MSRLDSFIRRLTAQRDVLNHICARMELPADGPIMEIGLGNGRLDLFRGSFGIGCGSSFGRICLGGTVFVRIVGHDGLRNVSMLGFGVDIEL